MTSSILVLTLGLTPFSGVSAQSRPDGPDGGELLRELEREDLRVSPERSEPQPELQAPQTREGPQVPVQRFQFEGNTLLSDAELEKAVESWLGKKLTMAELQFIADTVAERFRQEGYLVRTYLPQQEVDDGSIRIVVVEARLGKVKIDPGEAQQLRLSPDYARAMVSARQQPGEILALDDLQRGIQLLSDTPGVEAVGVLAAGEEEGHTDVVVRVSDEPLVAGDVTLDNAGSRSTGEARVRPSLTLNNMSGSGDQLKLDTQFSSGSQYARLRYGRALGHDGLRGGLSASHFRYELGEEFEALDFEGDATTLGADMRYPLIRERVHNLNLIARVAWRDYEDRAFGNTTSDKSVRALTLGIDGNLMDSLGGGGFNYYSLALVTGNLDLSDNPQELSRDKSGPRRDGSYQKFTANLGRQQRLDDKTSLLISLRGQVAGDNLDSSEDFGLGGVAGVRAYPGLEGSGDEGVLASLELSRRLTPSLTAMVFYDHGWVREHKDFWSGWNLNNPDQPRSYELNGAGVGLNWSWLDQLSVRGYAARRFGSNPVANPTTGKDADGTLRSTRFWLTATYSF